MELERLLAAMKRRWWLIAALGVLGALAGLAADASRPDSFTATATVEVAPNRNVYGSETVLNRIVVNELGTIESLQMREDVVSSLGTVGQDIDPVEDLNAQQVTDTELVAVSVSASNQSLAITAANRWAETYVDFVRERERAELENQLEEANNNLDQARTDRLLLDAELREAVVVRPSNTVATYNETVLREPALWDSIVKLDQEIELFFGQRSSAELRLANVLDSRIVSTAAGPIDPLQQGNGLGPIQGALIALSLGVALVAIDAQGRMSLRAAGQITGSVWPTSLRLARHRFVLPWRRRKMARDVSAVGAQILARLPDTRLQVVSFAGVDKEGTEDLKAALAQDLQARGYSVSLMGDQRSANQSRTVDGMLDLLHAEESVVFADLGELQSKRFTGRIMTVVAIDEHRDTEELVAQQISDSVEISDSVLTVVAR